MSKYKINTTCVQGGYEPGNGEPRQVPIYQIVDGEFKQIELYDLHA